MDSALDRGDEERAHTAQHATLDAVSGYARRRFRVTRELVGALRAAQALPRRDPGARALEAHVVERHERPPGDREPVEERRFVERVVRALRGLPVLFLKS